MNLNQLRFVRAVVDAGTFTAAARRCYVTQSTLSAGIGALEHELGQRLFERTTRSVALTPFGLRLLPMIDGVLAAQSDLVDTARAYRETTVRRARIGVCPLVDSRRLERALGPWRAAHPDVAVTLEPMAGGRARAAMAEGRLDLIVGPARPRRRERHRAALYDDPLLYLPSGRVPPPDPDRTVRLSDIAGDVFLMVGDNCGLNAHTRRMFRSRRLTLNEYGDSGVSFQVLEEWARLGVGSAILPLSKATSPRAGHPITLANGHRATIRFEARWSPDHPPGPHLRAFIDALQEGPVTT